MCVCVCVCVYNKDKSHPLYCPTNAHELYNPLIIKIVKIMKAAPTCFGSHKTIIREPHPVLS